VHWFVALHRLTRLESCSTRERNPRDVCRFSRISPFPSSRKFRALAGKNGEVSSSRGNRVTFAGLPRLFGDSCANLFRARNPICLRLIVLLLSLPFLAAHSSCFTGAVVPANYCNPPMIEWSLPELSSLIFLNVNLRECKQYRDFNSIWKCCSVLVYLFICNIILRF